MRNSPATLDDPSSGEEMRGLELRVLGPVEVWTTDGPIHLARRQQRLILGILGIEANRVVSRDRLIDLLWGGQPPRLARAVLQTRVSELRTTLASRSEVALRLGLHTRGSGYVLTTHPELVDIHRFRQLVDAARDRTSLGEVRRLLRSALDLWRGQVLGGWLPADAHAALCSGIEGERLSTAEDLFDAELRLGNQRSIADEITELAAAHPARERLVAMAMMALHRSGRTAEALFLYERCRRWLADELGVDPGGELQDLHRAVLRGDVVPSDATSDTGEDSADGRRSDTVATQLDDFRITVPRILPADIPDFTGRTIDVARIRQLLIRNGDEPRVVALAGPAGVGKTALSIHVAHQVRQDFPDGQLFANLHGIGDEPATPIEVLGRFLRALGVDGSGMPHTLDERVDLFRSLLADLRILVVLDNVGSAEQVLPLVPGGEGCAVLINSRARLGHAIGADTVILDVLDSSQTIELFARMAGPRRIQLEAEAAADLAWLCGYLPLAVRVAAAKLATKPHWSVRRLVERLSDERQRLDHLTYGHLDVRSSIEMSYSGMPADSQLLLRRLGDTDLPEINVWTAASLLDTAASDAEEVLEQLYDAQLMDIAGRDLTGHARYRLHDLVRLLAREHAEADEATAELDACRVRAAGAWLSFAEVVHRGVYGGGYMTIGSPAVHRTIEHDLAEAFTAAPLQWFDHERLSVVAMIRQTARSGYASHCWGITAATSPLFQMRYLYDDWTTVLHTALAATERAEDQLGRAAILHQIGGLHADRRDYSSSMECLRHAIDAFEQLGHQYGRAIATITAAQVNRLRGDLDSALRGYKQALPAIRGDHGGEAYALRGIGQVYMTRGDVLRADRYLAEALQVARQRGSRRSEAQALFWQGMLRLRGEDYAPAQSLFAEALILAQSLGDRPGEAQAMRGLGLSHKGTGEMKAAAETLSAALHLVQQPRPTSIETSIRRELADVLHRLDIEPIDIPADRDLSG